MKLIYIPVRLSCATAGFLPRLHTGNPSRFPDCKPELCTFDSRDHRTPLTVSRTLQNASALLVWESVMRFMGAEKV